MNPGRFYLPRVGNSLGPIISNNYLPVRGNLGLFGRITNSLRSFNWSGLLNGANKTLNVVNQTIPLVRQAGPMFNNMKSMLKLARAFGSETTSNRTNNKNIMNKAMTEKNSKPKSIIINDTNRSNNVDIQKKEIQNDNYPNFFV